MLIAGNWKMNHGPKDTGLFFNQFKELVRSSLRPEAKKALSQGDLRACLIPPFLSLAKARADSADLPFPVSIGAQNAHWEKTGAFTGEISGPILKEIGISWVLIGHSERRQFFGETDATVQKRTRSLLEQDFHVILCIGETRGERESGQTETVLTRQIKEALPKIEEITRYLDGRLILAYEPVWAIGTGLTATPEQAEDAHRIIRKLILEGHGTQAAEKTPILYGGSVTPENALALLSSQNIDGALVGGASLKPESYFSLIQTAAQILL
jgi:triosephosphate isomerase